MTRGQLKLALFVMPGILTKCWWTRMNGDERPASGGRKRRVFSPALGLKKALVPEAASSSASFFAALRSKVPHLVMFDIGD